MLTDGERRDGGGTFDVSENEGRKGMTYGAGPVDFKFSSGYHSKVLLEMKLARNSQLMHGIEVQLPTYLKAESSSKGIYMIVIANNHDEELVNALWKRMKAQNIPESLTQNIIVIDARKRNSASRL